MLVLELILGGLQQSDKMKTMHTLMAFCTGLLLMSCEKDDVTAKFDSLLKIARQTRMNSGIIDKLAKDSYMCKLFKIRNYLSLLSLEK
jgi:hypothetical protein